MSEEKFAEIESRLDVLKWIVGLGWALIASAFALGVWVATLEIRQSSFSARLTDSEISIKNHGTEINSLHVKEAVHGSDLAYIKAAVERIEKKL